MIQTYLSVVYTNLLSENGVIEFNEFLYLMAEIALDGDSEAELLEVFRILDRDNDGWEYINQFANKVALYCNGF